MIEHSQLFSDFHPITKETWIEKIQQDLKGKPFEKLFWHPEKDIALAPFYMQSDLKTIPHITDALSQKALNSSGNWYTAEWFNLEDKTIFTKIKTAINNDVSSVIISVTKEGLKKIEALVNILITENKKIRKISFRGENTILQHCITNTSLLNFISNNPDIEISFGFNFLSEQTISGKQSQDISIIASLKDKFESFENIRYLLVNGNYFHDAGSSIVQELAYSLAIGNTYQSFFDKKNSIVNRIEFLFATGNNYFFEIAKLRAFRILWAKLLQLHNKTFDNVGKIFLSSQTTLLNKTIYAPHVNMLRNTTEAMAAIIGGTNELTIFPFNFLFIEDDDFGKRIARNIQHLLRYETHLNKVYDIAAGSYYIENLTHQLAENSWKLFSDIENNGGYEKMVESGKIKYFIEENAKKIIHNFNIRKKILVGINNYPNISETVIEKGSLDIQPQVQQDEKGLRLLRLATQIENIRFRTEKLFSKKPKVFLFTYGNITFRRARASFALNFLGTAGFNILDNNGFQSTEEGIAAFNQSGADILVVCSSDEEYEAVVPAIASHLDNKILIVAGNPDFVKVNANVDFYIFSEANILTTLQKIQERLLKIQKPV